jgi:hypothetical protein
LSKKEEAMIDGDNFKFIFLVSFHTKEDSIALELLEAFDRLCLLKGKQFFELFVRISKENPARWDK